MRFVTPRRLFVCGLRWAVYDPSRAAPVMIDQYRRLNLRPDTREANLTRFSLPLDLGPATQLGDIARPAFLLWGREDKLISPANAACSTRRGPSPSSSSTCGHLPMEELAARSAGDVLAFIAARP
jgi:pimeloyl-ACP methyl ester carboxylesterase